MNPRIGVAIEAGARKVFATAVDWPGWSRSGNTEAAALEALVASAERYAIAAAAADEPFTVPRGAADLDVVERVPGGTGTDFGVPSRVTQHDRRPVSEADAARLRRFVAGAWTVFDRTSASAPAELRKGPRGGGRDRDKIVDHVLDADQAYCREIGLRIARPERADPAAITSMRSAMLELIGAASDGSPLGGRHWPPRYAAGRIAWHALDHAWEMEDRT